MGLNVLIYEPVFISQKETDEYFDIDCNVNHNFTIKYSEDIRYNKVFEKFKDFVFIHEVQVYSWKEIFQEMNLNFEDFETIGASYDENFIVEFESKLDKSLIKIANPRTHFEKMKCIAVKEISNQRKGANGRFYSDGIWDSDPVLDKKTLLDHWKKYFSKTVKSKAYGALVEYEMSEKERTQYFKENIIDKFIEGKNFVLYA